MINVILPKELQRKVRSVLFTITSGVLREELKLLDGTRVKSVVMMAVPAEDDTYTTFGEDGFKKMIDKMIENPDKYAWLIQQS